MPCSTLDELANGEFQPVIGEVDTIDAKKVTRVIFCSGKVYYDLVAARRERKITHIAIARLEQLYPFPQEPSGDGTGQVSEGDRDRLVPGRAAQPGCLVLDRLASASRHAQLSSKQQSAAGVASGVAVAGGRLSQPSTTQQQKALIESALGEIEY